MLKLKTHICLLCMIDKGASGEKRRDAPLFDRIRPGTVSDRVIPPEMQSAAAAAASDHR